MRCQEQRIQAQSRSATPYAGRLAAGFQPVDATVRRQEACTAFLSTAGRPPSRQATAPAAADEAPGDATNRPRHPDHPTTRCI